MATTPQATKPAAVAIFEPQNVETIVKLAPDSYARNVSSHAACLAAGNALLARVKAQGMDDALDQEVAKFIEKSKITVKNMNLRRSPVTQLFDQLRKVYTSLENDVDPAKAGTVGAQLQAVRNAYAAKKREEAERLRLQEEARRAAELARTRYRQEVDEDYRRQLNTLIVTRINELSAADRAVTLENIDDTARFLKSFPVALPQDWSANTVSTVRLPLELAPDESRDIQAASMAALITSLAEQYAFEVGGTRDDILDRLPSKRTELQRAAKACAEEAARIREQMAKREAEEAARKEAARLEREKQEKAASQLAAQKAEMEGLFAGAGEQAVYQPKVSAKKRVSISKPDDIMAVISFWWANEGQRLPLDELAKTFKKQITYAEKCANATLPVFISGIEYADEIKAK